MDMYDLACELRTVQAVATAVNGMAAGLNYSDIDNVERVVIAYQHITEMITDLLDKVEDAGA
ncbi:MAG: hypothetical protein KBA55_14970 [Ruminococcus sp.]|nr:hypothetical protein [Ruminococcus sp.]